MIECVLDRIDTRVKLKDLDGISSDTTGARDQRFPSNFKVVINFRPEKDIKKMEIVKSPSNSLGLIFASQAEHESNHNMMELCEKSASNGRNESPLQDNGSVPKAPPRLKQIHRLINPLGVQHQIA